MTQLLVIGIAVSAFFLRDVLLLKAAPPANVRRHLWLYSSMLVLFVVPFCLATETLQPEEILALVRSSTGATATIALYALILAMCLWIRRSSQYDRAWVITLAPNPLLLIGIAAGSRMLAGPGVVFGGLVAALWIVCVTVSVKWTGKLYSNAGELEHSIDFAGMINAFAFCVIPFESLFGRSDSFPEILRQVVG